MPEDHRQYGLRTGDGAWLFPIAKAYKRFENGRGDGFGLYADGMVDLYGSEAPDSNQT